MTPVARTRTLAPVMALTVLFLAGSARPARADITAFLGLSPTPERHMVKGFSGGLSFLVVGFEFEFSHLGEDELDHLPGLKTYSGNVFAQTPIEIKGTQLYATAGAGAYRETLGDAEETHVGINLGGGAKIRLLGPLRIRLDYRVFQLRGSPLFSTYQRFYAGGNIAF
ncbi:MAG: hypothetical protein Q7R30_12725 [Acidobacteriota bacterium]|nr:hypothetical protein [Acidobacteriota bacterium]